MGGKTEEKKEKKKDKKKDEGPKIRVTHTHLVNTNEKNNKIVQCCFHQVLPWVCLVPKHGGKLIIWDYATEKLIAELSLLDLLSSQVPHPNTVTDIPKTADGRTDEAALQAQMAEQGIKNVHSWTDALLGSILSVSFLDEGCLMWQRFLAQSHVRPATVFSEEMDEEEHGAATPSAAAAGGGGGGGKQINADNPLFAEVGPHHDPTEEHYFLHNSAAAAAQGGGAGAGAGAGGKAGPKVTGASEGARDTSLIVIAQNITLVVSVGTATIHRTLLSSNMGNRMIQCCQTLPVVGSNNPIVVLGCGDGCMVLWDPVRAMYEAGNFTAEDEHGLIDPNQGSLLKRECISIHQTGGSGITCIEQHLFILPKPCGQDEHLYLEIEGPSTFRGAYVTMVVGTSAGHVSLLKFPNRDDHEVLFKVRKVHDKILALAVTPIMPQERFVDAPHVYKSVTTSSEFDEFVRSLCNGTNVYSLGPLHIVQSDCKTGTEIRKIKVGGMKLINLIPQESTLLMVSSVGKTQYRIGYDLNQAQDQEHWLDVGKLFDTSFIMSVKQNANNNTKVSQQTTPGESRTTSSIAIHKPSGSDIPFQALILPHDPDSVKIYSFHVNPLLPHSMYAVCTDMGLMVLHVTVIKAGDIQFVQQLPRIPKSALQMSGGDGGDGERSIAQTAVSAYTTSSSFTGGFGADGLANADKFEFVYCQGPTGKTASATVHIPHDVQSGRPCTAMLLPMLAETAVTSSASASSSAKKDGHIINRYMVSEVNQNFKVTKLVPSPNGCLVAALTDTREVSLYDASHGYQSVTMPGALTQGVDKFVWASSNSSFAVMSLDPKKIFVGTVKKVHTGGGHSTYHVGSQFHEVVPANVPIGISGGRWLMVHYQHSFSGLSSQFYRWESSNAGGGAVGGFLPQPLLIQWDRLATLCALAYPTCIVFMEARRKVFAKVNAVDVTTPPTDMAFCNRALFVMFEREVMLLMPTKNIVQKIIVASLNPSLVTQSLSLCLAAKAQQQRHQEQQRQQQLADAMAAAEGDVPGLRESVATDPEGGGKPTKFGAYGSSNDETQAQAADFAYKAQLRPPGNLKIKGVIKRSHVDDPDKHILSLIVADEVLRVFIIPLSHSLTQLLLTIHSYTSILSTPADRLFVQRRLLRTVGDGPDAIAGTNKMFIVAVHQFCNECGCDVLTKAEEAGLINGGGGAMGGRQQSTDLAGSGDDTQAVTAVEVSVVDLRVVEGEIRYLMGEKIRLSQLKATGTTTVAATVSGRTHPRVMSAVVRKLMGHASESHSGGWTTQEGVIKCALEAIQSSASRLVTAAATRAGHSGGDQGKGASGTALLGPAARARYDVLMDIAFELFQHLPITA